MGYIERSSHYLGNWSPRVRHLEGGALSMTGLHSQPDPGGSSKNQSRGKDKGLKQVFFLGT